MRYILIIFILATCCSCVQKNNNIIYNNIISFYLADRWKINTENPSLNKITEWSEERYYKTYRSDSLFQLIRIDVFKQLNYDTSINHVSQVISRIKRTNYNTRDIKSYKTTTKYKFDIVDYIDYQKYLKIDFYNIEGVYEDKDISISIYAFCDIRLKDETNKDVLVLIKSIKINPQNEIKPSIDTTNKKQEYL